MLGRGSARSYALEVAVAGSRSATIREQAAGPLGKDLGCLNAFWQARRCDGADVAADAGVRRLADLARWMW